MSATAHQQLGRLTDTLRRTVRVGRVVTAGPDYDAGRSIWNGAVSARPGVIVRCAGPAEARAAVLALAGLSEVLAESPDELTPLWEPADTRAAEHRAWASNLTGALEADALPGGYPNLLGPDEVAQIATRLRSEHRAAAHHETPFRSGPRLPRDPPAGQVLNR